jgi:RNA polymerase sigma-70 factor (ECF subfamily)
MDDVEIVRRVLAGETELFEILVKRYQRLVYSKVSRTVYEPTLVEEAVQRTFVQAYEDLASFNPKWKPTRKRRLLRRTRRRRPKQQWPFRSWLMGIASHRAVDVLREQGATPAPIGEDDGTEDQLPGLVPATDEGQDPTDILAEKAKKDRLWQALLCLPRLERFCVILHCMMGRSFPKTAKRLRCSESQAKRAVKRGLKGMKRLDKRFHFSGRA